MILGVKMKICNKNDRLWHFWTNFHLALKSLQQKIAAYSFLDQNFI